MKAHASLMAAAWCLLAAGLQLAAAQASDSETATPSATLAASVTPSVTGTPTPSTSLGGSPAATPTNTPSPLIVGVKALNDAQRGGAFFGLVMGLIGTTLVFIAAYRHLPGPKDGTIPTAKSAAGDAGDGRAPTPTLSAASTASSSGLESPSQLAAAYGAGTGAGAGSATAGGFDDRRTLQVGVTSTTTSTSAYTASRVGQQALPPPPPPVSTGAGGGGGVAYNPLRLAAGAAGGATAPVR